MRSLSYYYAKLYDEDYKKYEAEDYEYEEWLRTNQPSYSSIKEQFKKSCSILTTLLVAGIAIDIIAKQFNFLLLHATLGSMLLFIKMYSKVVNEEKFVNDFFENKENILSKIEKDYPDFYITTENDERHKNVGYVIGEFDKTADNYYEKYKIPIFLSEFDYNNLYSYLKTVIDNNLLLKYKNYYDLFLDLLNRTYAKCLYFGKGVELNDFIEELYKIDQSETFQNETKIFENRMNISINGTKANIYDITEHRKK